MKDYLFGCIILSLIAAALTEGVPKSLEASVRCAVGVGLIVFAALPLGNMVKTAVSSPLPDLSIPEVDTDGFHEASKDAYLEGVKLHLSEKYSCPTSDFGITADGFDEKTLSAKTLHVTLRGEAVYLDYRALSEYVESSLKVVTCDVQIEFS